jgi:di/tricarboxylate transporter
MKNKTDLKWVLIVTILAFVISVLMTLFSKLTLENVFDGMENGKIVLKANGKEIPLSCSYTKRQIDILKAGGLLAYTKGE